MDNHKVPQDLAALLAALDEACAARDEQAALGQSAIARWEADTMRLEADARAATVAAVLREREACAQHLDSEAGRYDETVRVMRENRRTENTEAEERIARVLRVQAVIIRARTLNPNPTEEA